MFNKLKNKRGFTLTEVMIGMMILTIAIVSAANLLVNLRSSNQANLTTLQAYYYAVEGIEAVRNIRDSNWLHNNDWLGGNTTALWGADLSREGSYGVNLLNEGFSRPAAGENIDYNDLGRYKPWTVVSGPVKVRSVDGFEERDFMREILIESYDANEDALLVTSRVTWTLNGRERSVELSEILTNWKDGVF